MNTATATASPRLRPSPSFVQAVTMDGRPYVVQEAEPYLQFWLNERERQLLAQFGRRHGCSADEAVAACLRDLPAASTASAASLARKLHRTTAQMCEAGVLVDASADSSRYDAAIAPHYLAHRPFPPELVQAIVRRSGIVADSPVLDLAGGPGDLALALAGVSRQVAMLELSRGFVATARRRARAAGRPLAVIHESANRLPQQADRYALITVSQALHWLDDVAVVRGVCRALLPGGSFVVVHSAIELPDAHPLAWLLGPDSVLGAKPRRPFADELQPLQRRLGLLFEALDAPELERIDPTQPRGAGSVAQAIVPVAPGLYRQRRGFGLGFARGFLTPGHIAALLQRTGQTSAAFWRQVQQCCEGQPAEALAGVQHWALLQFRRGGAAAVAEPAGVIEIEGPAA